MNPKEPDSIEWIMEFIDTVTKNIEHFISDKSQVMRIRMEDANEQFPKFLEWIGAEGDLDAAVDEWTVRHNLGKKNRLIDTIRHKAKWPYTNRRS